MMAVLDQALALWGFDGAEVQLIAARENHVYRVTHQGQTVALRLHRPGYRTAAELHSELLWMAALAEGGLQVPAPLPARDGALLHQVEGQGVDVLSWLDGVPIGATEVPLSCDDRSGLFHRIGQTMAELHQISDQWQPPSPFTRCQWDTEGLVGEAPVWDRFWDNPTLAPKDRGLMLFVKESLSDMLRREEASLDYGLIHADFVRENLLQRADGNLQVIDFDDSGYGFRLFDLATALIQNLHEPDYEDLRAALLEGYLSVRWIDVTWLDLFILLRSASYLGWIIPRMAEPGAEARNARYLTRTRRLAQRWLAGV
ncbi:phosphotransferase enzyme family protein [Arenibacterium sp. LLYu02]|uniref:phosphotransferase enzyme family protein n=1 Tax=Arenibacterium sp. LLYu02 TaxID=3404132 RepID=UPI003B221821